MKLRLATALDAPDLARLENTQTLCAHWGENGWKTETAQPASIVWCAEEEGQLVGFAAMRVAAGLGEILNVAVHPNYCRRGIAFSLLSKLLQEARHQSCEELSLEVNIRNRAAISLYTKLGFLEVGRREKFYNAKEDALIMRISV